MTRKLRVEYPGANYHVMNRGGPSGTHLPGGHRSATVPQDPGRSLCQGRLASARVLSDGEPFPFGGGNTAGQSGGGHEMVLGDLHESVLEIGYKRYCLSALKPPAP